MTLFKAVLAAGCAVAMAAQAQAPVKPEKKADEAGKAAAEKKEDTPEQIALREVKPKTKVFTFDYGVPTSPAMKLSGLSSENLTASTSLKPFVLTLPDLLDGDAKGQSAALDFAPVAFYDRDLSFGVYSKLSDPERALRRTRVNMVAYRGVTDDDASKVKASRLTVGFSSSLLSSNDPAMAGLVKGRSYWDRCTDAAIDDFLPPPPAAGSARAMRAQAAETRRLLNAAKRDVERAVTDADMQAVWLEHGALIRSVVGGAPITTAPPAAAAAKPALSKSTKALAADLRAQADGRPAKDRDLLLKLADVLETLPSKEAAEAPAPASVENLSMRLTGLPKDELLTKLDEAAKAKGKEVDDLGPKADAEANKISADAGFKTSVAECSKKASAWASNGAALDIGGGALWSGAPGKFKSFDKGGGALWIAGKIPFKTFYKGEGLERAPHTVWSVGGSVRQAWREDVASGDDATPTFRADTTDAWAGVDVVTDRSRFALQYGWLRAEAKDKALDRFTREGDRYLATAALRLSSGEKGIWANLTYGSADGTTSSLRDQTLLLTLSIGPVDAPELFKAK